MCNSTILLYSSLAPKFTEDVELSVLSVSKGLNSLHDTSGTSKTDSPLLDDVTLTKPTAENVGVPSDTTGMASPHQS